MPAPPLLPRIFSIFFFLFCAALVSSSAQSVLQQRLSFSVENQPVSVALLELSKASGVAIGFSEALFQNPPKVSVLARDERLAVLLDRVLAGTNVDWRVADGQILLFKKPPPEQPLSGFVEDAETGERLTGAVVIDRNTGRVAVTNGYGFFSLNVLSGEQAHLVAHFVGFENAEKTLRPGRNRPPLILGLKSRAALSEITVSGDSVARSNSTPFHTRMEGNLDRLPLDRLPSLAGEPDLMRSAALLPGVGSDLDGLGGWSVRGGDVTQNRLVVDDALVFSPGHGLGLFSVFAPESVRSAQLWKGDAPARLGGAASSVLEVRTREGNVFRPSASASMGWLAGHLSVELPLPNERGAVLFSARRSLVGPVFRQLSRQTDEKDGRSGQSDYRFSDLHFKINHALGRRDRVYLSLFSGGDFFSDSSSQRFLVLDSSQTAPPVEFRFRFNSQETWKNSFASLRWNHLFSDRCFANTTVTASRLDLRSESQVKFSFFDMQQFASQTFSQSRLRDFSVKTDLDWQTGERLAVRGGAQVSLTQVLPFYYQGDGSFGAGNQWIQYGADSLVIPGANLRFENGWTVAAYGEADWLPWQNAHLRAGLRLESFANGRQRWLLPQPRLFWEQRWQRGFSSWISANWQAQTLKTVSPSGIESVSDLWLLSAPGVPPQQVLQLVLGSGVERRDWALRLEVFAKRMRNANEYAFNWTQFDTITNPEIIVYNNGVRSWQQEVESGQGRAWGAELLAEKKTGRTTGWVSLTLGRSERRFAQLSQNEWFPARFDRLAHLKVVGIHQFNRHLLASAAWQWATGDAVSSLLFYSDTKIRLLDLHRGGNQATRLGNGDYRQPNQHRLDASVQYRWQWRRLEQTLVLGAYNAYNRANTHFTFWVSNDSVEFGEPQRATVSGLPFLPYLTWSAKF